MYLHNNITHPILVKIKMSHTFMSMKKIIFIVTFIHILKFIPLRIQIHVIIVNNIYNITHPILVKMSHLYVHEENLY